MAGDDRIYGRSEMIQYAIIKYGKNSIYDTFVSGYGFCCL